MTMHHQSRVPTYLAVAIAVSFGLWLLVAAGLQGGVQLPMPLPEAPRYASTTSEAAAGTLPEVAPAPAPAPANMEAVIR